MSEIRHSPPLALKTLPYEIFAHQFDLPPGSKTDEHSHPWGQIDLSEQGFLECTVAGKPYLSPVQYAVWIPPNMAHSAFCHQAARFWSIYFSPELCESLPKEPCCLAVTRIFTAIVEDLVSRGIDHPTTTEDERLLQVLFDQVKKAKKTDTYLPYAESPSLRKILSALQSNPGDNRTLEEWADFANMTVRTLTRLSQRELRMSIGQWRARLRFMSAIAALDEQISIDEIAFTLGYSSASAFITAFRQMSGTTPAQHRNGTRSLI